MTNAVNDVETITQSEFQKRLGVSPAYLASRNDIKEWLQSQPGVVRVNQRRLAIPANLVDAARVRFAIKSRPARGSKNGPVRTERLVDYQKFTTHELLALKSQEEALLDGTDYNEKVREARKALADAETKAAAAKTAGARLSRVTKALDKRREELATEAERVAREQELIKQADEAAASSAA